MLVAVGHPEARFFGRDTTFPFSNKPISVSGQPSPPQPSSPAQPHSPASSPPSPAQQPAQASSQPRHQIQNVDPKKKLPKMFRPKLSVKTLSAPKPLTISINPKPYSLSLPKPSDAWRRPSRSCEPSRWFREGRSQWCKAPRRRIV